MAIKELIQKAREIVQKISPKEGLVDPEKLEIRESEFKGITELLSHVGAIKTARGTSKVYVSDSIKNRDAILGRLNTIEQTLNNIYEKIKLTPNKQLNRKEVSELLIQNGESEEDYYSLIGILSGLNLVTSIGGRTGGIKIYDESAELKPILEAEKEFSETTDEKKSEKKKSEREDILYPSASKFISDLGFQALILGTRRRFTGEWNTPDVIGYKVNPYKWLGGAELEIVSLEVKWEISKQAIAETNSHQNLSHRSYLLVYQFFDEIEESYRMELINKGIGLICRNRNKEGYEIYLPARRNAPENSDLDNFLDIAMDKDELQELKNELAKHFYASFLKPLFPK
jgi:hypothetical protein